MTGCDAIHPGYGFLSENPYIAEICEKVGVTFIGPTTEAIQSMADKVMARKVMRDAGLPIIPALKKPSPAPTRLVSSPTKSATPS